MRVAFVYPNPRGDLIHRIAAGEAPDTTLLGQNHLAAHGIDAFPYDSLLRRRRRVRGAVHRVTWVARELTLPWELRRADVAVTPLATLLPLAAAVRRRPRVVLLSYHVVAAWERAGARRRRLLRASLRAASVVTTAASAARDHLVERVPLDPRRVRVVHLGVDERWWTPLPPAPGGYVLAVGRDLARDYDTFARALESLDARGVIVAKQENMKGVRVPPNVDVRLDVSPREVRELYAGASCVVVPTVADSDPRGTESSGTVALLEAMACARPTIVTDRIYLRDYVSADATVVVPPDDPAALRAAVDAVRADPARAAAMGEAGRTQVEERHTTRLLAARLADVVRDAACA